MYTVTYLEILMHTTFLEFSISPLSFKILGEHFTIKWQRSVQILLEESQNLILLKSSNISCNVTVKSSTWSKNLAHQKNYTWIRLMHRNEAFISLCIFRAESKKTFILIYIIAIMEFYKKLKFWKLQYWIESGIDFHIDRKCKRKVPIQSIKYNPHNGNGRFCRRNWK